MYKVKTQAWTRWPCCHCKSCKTKLEHENKTFYCSCCIAAVARCRAVLPPACHGLSYYCQGETRGGAWTRGEPGHSLDTAWTHDRWWLASCPVFLGKFSGMIPTLHGEHGERLSEKALESVLRLLIMSTEKSWKTIINRIIS